MTTKSTARIAGRYLVTLREAGHERIALKAIESVVKMAFGSAGRFAFGTFGIDVLDAVPLKRIANRKFSDVRWPQIFTQAEGRRRPRR